MATFKVLLGIFLAAAIVGETAAKPKCLFGIPFGDKCYATSESAKEPYNVAQATCESSGGHLAVPRTQEEQDFLASLTYKLGTWFWLGCDDLQTEGEFLCADGAPTPTNFATFRGAQPDNGEAECRQDFEEDCVAMTMQGEWADQPCHWNRKYVCQFPAL